MINWIDVDKTVEDLQRIIKTGSNQDFKEVAERLVRVHLTHQQRIGAFVYEIVKALNNYPYTDLRNEQTKKMTKTIMEKIGDDYYFPFI